MEDHRKHGNIHYHIVYTKNNHRGMSCFDPPSSIKLYLIRLGDHETRICVLLLHSNFDGHLRLYSNNDHKRHADDTDLLDLRTHNPHTEIGDHYQ